MCGIVGILARGAPVSPEILEKATRSLAHRGPDDSGTILFRQASPEPVEVGFGSRRLAILDLSPLGHQPMQDSLTGNWIVFNGEIYNYGDIRAELERNGVAFTSNSDTEVLLKAYGRWGRECLKHLRGMFAFAIWDAKRGALFVARDPMGIKPLYYYHGDKHLLFASELRTLLGTGLIPRKLDPAGLLNYLSFGSAYDPNTLVSGIAALQPGHFLTWQDGQLETTRYWDLIASDGQRSATRQGLSRDAVREEIRELLLGSVRLHMVSDVPVGVFLSGGIDSSSLVALLTELGVRPNTFSLVFEESKYDEGMYSRDIAREFGTEHHEICISQRDALDALPGAMGAMDQPSIDGVNTYLISRRVHEAGLKVAVSGLGGDELFAGYSSFRTVPRMERFAYRWRRMPGLLRSGTAALISWTGSSDQKRKVSELVRNPEQTLHPCFLSRMLFTPTQVGNLVPQFYQENIHRAADPVRQLFERSRTLDPVNRVSYLEARGYMANTLLRDSDVMSMAHSLELRVPLIDARLAKCLQSIPGSWKLNGRVPKPLLVHALGRQLPESIVRRPKQGFTLPFDSWLRQEMRRGVEATLTGEKQNCLSSILNMAAVREVWKDFLAGRTSWSRPWSLFVLAKWCDLHL